MSLMTNLPNSITAFISLACNSTRSSVLLLSEVTQWANVGVGLGFGLWGQDSSAMQGA